MPFIMERPIPDFRGGDTVFMGFRKALLAPEKMDQPANGSSGWVYDSAYPPAPSVQYFDFDPNQVGFEELLRLGLSARVARTWVNYLNSGGKFREKPDLMKVYGLGEADFKRLEAYIDLPPVPVPDAKKRNAGEFELNAADSLQLQGIYGIGPVFAARIIKYRDLLGGYYTREQLKEVYGLGEQQYEEIFRHAIIDTGSLRHINLNTVERETLSSHPYLTAYQADAIIAYRDFTGGWKDIREIQRNHILPDSVFKRIRPYLKVEK
jgi:competence ComEA-like helix-hairpin-helix protein